MKRRIVAIVIVAVIIVGVIAVVLAANKRQTVGQPTNTTPNTNSATAQSSQTSAPSNTTGQVTMTNMLFTPSQISVKNGESVTWSNKDTTAHTVTIDKGNGPNSGPIAPGSTYTYTFNQTGSFQYHCDLHSAMHGTIVVN
jgi:plastocyanin